MVQYRLIKSIYDIKEKNKLAVLFAINLNCNFRSPSCVLVQRNIYNKDIFLKHSNIQSFGKIKYFKTLSRLFKIELDEWC